MKNNFFKNKSKKIIISAIASLSILDSISFADMIDENIYQIPISSGITFKKIEQTFDDGANSIYLTIADLNNSNLSLDLLYSNTGFANRKELSKLDAQNPNSVVSINGDFFSMSDPSYSIGAMIENGKVISTSTAPNNQMATFMTDYANNMMLDYINSGAYIINSSTGSMVSTVNVNKHSNTFAYPMVLTNEYRKFSIGAKQNLNMVEIVVENDTVIDVRNNDNAVAIPTNGYVIVASGQNGEKLLNNISVGDVLKIESNAQKTFENIKTAIGGGTLVLKNGQITPITHQIKGKSQRSAIGVTFDNKLVFMVADGRTSSYQGMNENDVAKFLKSQNIKDAMMFDGGGSSEMIVNGKIMNRLSNERKILNGLSISNNASKSGLSKIVAVLESDNITQGDKVKLIAQGFDYNMNPIKLDNLSVSGSGVNVSYENNYITALSGGKGNIIVKSGGVSTQIPVNISSVNPTDPYLKASTGQVDILIVGNTNPDKESIWGQIANANTLELAKSANLTINMFDKNPNFKNEILSRKESIASEKQTINTSSIDFVSLKTKQGIGSKKQWDTIKKALNSSKNNIVFLVDGKIDISLSEKKILRKLINNSNKKVFIVYQGVNFSSFAEGNTSYIEIPDNTITKNKKDSDYRVLSFRNQNGKIVYSFENLIK